MGTDVFVYHGYSEISLDGHWRKASSAFNKELCERFGTKVLEFDGASDALLHAFDEGGNQHMEYVRQRGSYADLPFDEIMATFDEVYGAGLPNAPGDIRARRRGVRRRAMQGGRRARRSALAATVTLG